MALVNNSFGKKRVCRVFLDSGSEPHLISEQCVDFLGLERKKTCVSLNGIGSSFGGTCRGTVQLTLFSRVRDFSLTVNALIMPKLTGLMPRVQCKGNWSHLEGLTLADPSFNKPGQIDILLGAKVAASLMLPGMLEGPLDSPVAQNSKFGWILSGSVASAVTNHLIQVVSNHVSCDSESSCVESALEKFWNLEEPETHEVPLSVEDKECEQHFLATHERNPDGTYVIELPFKSKGAVLGSSRESALKRLKQLEIRLSKDPKIKEEYIKQMREAINSNHMELIPPEELKRDEVYYMPHHVVIKEDSTTTPYRVVYDASAKTSNGISLNDTLMTGPKLQEDLISLLIRFRVHQVPMSADIAKMYNQTHVKPKHTDYQRILWRESSEFPVQEYRLLRVTFGVKSAPYLGVRCLHQLADDEITSFPQAAKILKEDFVVDNLLSGASDMESALKLQRELLQIMDAGKLNLRKWSSSYVELLEAVPFEKRSNQIKHRIDQSEVVKTIGLLWNPRNDTFSVSIKVPPNSSNSSKRKVLSAVAKVFDPLGWLSPVTIKPKILMQELWKLKLDWDSPLPLHLQRQWIAYCKELETLKLVKINRHIFRAPSSHSLGLKYQLHGFCDASKWAYAACVYSRVTDSDGQSTVELVAAKTRVAPIKSESIPRLELCGALLLTKLLKTVRTSIKFDIHVLRCWTDSTIVLDWIKSKAKLDIFVSNRVRKIQNSYPHELWSHVPGEDNPADDATRGITASSLIENSRWFHGPSWLSTAEFEDDIKVNSHAVEFSFQESSISLFIKKCSSYTKMKKVIACCLQFIDNCKLSRREILVNYISVKSLDRALLKIIICVQNEVFADEIKQCERKMTVKSNIKFLTPFLDKNKILRVGGRLSHSSLSYEQKCPILLPRRHNFTEQVVKYFHLTYQHAGPQLLLALIRDKFWIMRGTDVVKLAVKKCILCHRQKLGTMKQIMGQLPSSRVNQSRPFSQCGVDYAGPFQLCLISGRNPRLMKSYVSVFICMVTKAVHLELVGDLSTPCFIGALTRMISRRGLPADIYCDGGTNFIGARNEMVEFLKLIKSQKHRDVINNFLSERGITYHINPPYAPHHGGLWEAGVKSMKYHLKRIMENRRLSIEEFSTVLCQVESCLNSRPISPMSSDPNDYSALTPGHFLVGSSLAALPQHNIIETKHNRLSRWQAVQQINQHFWKRWHKEYLSRLQSCPKWYKAQPDLKVGDLVLMLNEEQAWGPLKWKLGRIIKTYPGKDQKVRVCDIKTSTGNIYRRPIVKLSLLPVNE